jgi:tetratricopeptide (TPR) repeat protein
MPGKSSSSTELASMLPHRILALALSGLLAAPTASLAAPPKSKVIVALVAAAQREFDGGNFDRAGDLFLEIFRQDPSQIAALYNAARAHHLAGKLSKAEELYGELLALPGALDAATTSKVQGLVQEVRRKRGEAKADEAERAESAGNYAFAAEKWAEAGRFAPERSGWTLRAARAEQLAGRADAARSLYDKYLTIAPTDAADRANAEKWRRELGPGYAAATLPQPAGTQAPTLPAKVENSGAPKWAYATMAAGALSLIGGGVVLGMAAGDHSDLQAKLDQRNAAGRVATTTFDEAAVEASRIEGRYQLGWVLSGVGVAAAGIGGWAWWRSDARVVLAPSLIDAKPAGLALAGRF